MDVPQSVSQKSQTVEDETCLIRFPTMSDLYSEDMASLFESDVDSQSEFLTNLIKETKSTFNKTTPSPNTEDRSFLKAVPSYSLQILTNIGNTYFDDKFFERVIFLKIVGKFLFFSMSDLKLLIYEKTSESLVTELLANPIISMDYDPISDYFLFGFKNGKIGFAKFDLQQKHLLFDDQNKNDVFADGPITHVKLVSQCDVLLIMTSTNKAFFLIRIHPTKFKFKSRILLDGSKKTEIFDEINAVRIKDEQLSDTLEPTLMSSFIVTIASSTLIYFVTFITLTKNYLFSEFVHDSLRILSKIEYPYIFVQKISSKESASLAPIRMTELGLETRKKTFVVCSVYQWLAESSPAFYIVWENILQRFELSVNFELILTLTTQLPLPIVCCFLGAIEFLVCLDAEFELNLIQLDKIRHHMELDLITNVNGVFSKEYLFTKTNRNRVLCGHDVMEKGFATLNASFVQYFEVISWDEYLNKLLREKASLAILTVLHDIIHIRPLPLHGILNYQGQFRTSTISSDLAIKNFAFNLEKVIPGLVGAALAGINEGSSGEFMNPSFDLIELALDIIIKTNTFQQVYASLISAVLRIQELNPFCDVSRRFLTELVYLFSNTKLFEQIDPEFFIFVFQFAKFEAVVSILEHFLVFLIIRFEISGSLLFSLKMSACNKHLYGFLYFVLVTDAEIETNLSHLGQIITEFKNNKVANLKNYLTQILIYLFDLFADRKLPKACGVNPQIADESIQQAALWFLEHLEDFFSNCCLKRSIRLLHKIYKPLPRRNKTLNVVLKLNDPMLCFSDSLNDKIAEGINSDDFGVFYAIYALSFLLLPFEVKLSEEYNGRIYQNLITIIESGKNELVSQFNPEVFEFVALKFQIQNHFQFQKMNNFLNKTTTDFADLLKLEINNKTGLFFQRLLRHRFFFPVSLLKIKNGDLKSLSEIALFLKHNRTQISIKNSSFFHQLIRELPIEHIVSFAEEFKSEPQFQLKILQSLEKSALGGNVSKEFSGVYLRLLCQINPLKVVPFLRANIKLNINEKLVMCQENKHMRGEAYCLKKIANFVGSRIVYFKLLRRFFDVPKRGLGIIEKNQVLEIAQEMVDENNEEQTCLTLRELVVFFCEYSEVNSQTCELIRPLFVQLFNFDVINLLSEFKKFGEFGFLKTCKPFFEQLSLNYKTLDFSNTNIKSIIETRNLQLKEHILEIFKKGTAFVQENCIVCGKFKNEMSGELIYHKCKKMIHDVCQIEIRSFRCQVCQQFNLGFFIRQFFAHKSGK